MALQRDGIGYAITVTIEDENGSAVDVSGASTLSMVLQDPSNNNTTKTAVNNTDGTDGKIKYVTVSGDLDEAGRWRVQCNVIDASTNRWTTVGHFHVVANL